MLTQEWSQPVDAEHQLFTAASDIKDADGHVLVTAYAVLRPDGQWSLLLINKDYDNLTRCESSSRTAKPTALLPAQ